VQDLIGITDQVKLLAGARWSYQETRSNVLTYADNKTATTVAYDDAVTPRFGIVFQPITSMSIFASYSNSFTLNTGVDVDGNALPPSFLSQYEAGIKNDLFDGMLSANLTVYQILNSNMAQTSLANGNTNANIKELAGEVTSKGVEVDVMTRPYNGFSLIAGYSYNQTKYTRSNTYIEGSELRYNPHHTANASINYDLDADNWMNGLSAGASVTYIGDRVAGRSTRLTVQNDVYRLMPIPAYAQVDLSLGYQFDNLALRFKVANLFDALSYYVHDDNSVNPIAPRTFSLTTSMGL
jgi:iron complex outermembrane receptor protein